ncbi:unnamed protein product [Ectocarpus sp. 6 AP-2014]
MSPYQQQPPASAKTPVTAPSPAQQQPVGSELWKRDIEGPFRRLDPNPDAFELARLALCAITIVPLRVVLIAVFLSSYYVLALSFMTVAPDRPWAHAISIFCVRWASRFLLLLLGYWTVDVKGMEENAGRRGEPRVFVSNHISFIEVLVFLHQLGPSFVMKRTCLRVPLIGGIAARIVDCVPVDNKGGKAGGSGSQAIATRLLRMFGEEALANGGIFATAASQQQESAPEGEVLSSNGDGATKSKPTVAEENWARGWRGNPLLLFPEGTTSNGSCLLRFKTGVFAGGVPVHPVTVKYEARRFSPAFESIYFPVHAFRSLAEPAHHVTVEYLPRFVPTPEQRADRTLYAKAVQRVFCEAMDLPAVEAGYAEKTLYHTYLRKQFQGHPWGRLALLLPAPDRHNAKLLGSSAGCRAGEGGDRGPSAEGTGGGGGGDVGHEAACAAAVGPDDSSIGDGVGGQSSIRRRTGKA